MCAYNMRLSVSVSMSICLSVEMRRTASQLDLSVSEQRSRLFWVEVDIAIGDPPMSISLFQCLLSYIEPAIRVYISVYLPHYTSMNVV